MDERLAGGMDAGARLVDGSVRRPFRDWTPSVHDLLGHLERQGFEGAPQVLGIDDHGREMLTYLEGQTVGHSSPWPAWTHSDATLIEMGAWLRRYHDAVASYQPSADATWREGGHWKPGLIIGHGDPAPYNAVWDGRLIGLIDWDNAGPVLPQEDAAWVAFGWTPLHARQVVVEEGFTDFTRRRRRLAIFLQSYEWSGTLQEAIDLIGVRLEEQIRVMHALAAQGDLAYVAMVERGQHRLLQAARDELVTV
jgi:hypothetical protein